MAEIVRMPKMSDTMTEGVVAKWHKNIGDMVKSGDLVAEIETDKATMEFESYQEGVLLYKGVEEGKSAPVDGILAIFGKAGEDYKSLLETESSKPAATPNPAPIAAPVVASTPAPTPVVTAPTAKPVAAPVPVMAANDDSRVKASPLAKRLAMEKGIDLSRIPGSGDGGRVVKRDVDWFKPGMSSIKIHRLRERITGLEPVTQIC